MNKLTDNILTECCICGTPLSGFNLNRRDGKYYCEPDFQRTSPEELAENERLKNEREQFGKVFNTDEC